MTIRFLKLSLASPECIRSWTERILPNGKKVGKILKGDLIDYKNGLPIRDGLSCERIFGPMISFTCSCGRFKCLETRGIHIVHDTLRTSRPNSSTSSNQQWSEFNNAEPGQTLERKKNLNLTSSPSFRPTVLAGFPPTFLKGSTAVEDYRESTHNPNGPNSKTNLGKTTDLKNPKHNTRTKPKAKKSPTPYFNLFTSEMDDSFWQVSARDFLQRFKKFNENRPLPVQRSETKLSTKPYLAVVKDHREKTLKFNNGSLQPPRSIPLDVSLRSPGEDLSTVSLLSNTGSQSWKSTNSLHLFFFDHGFLAFLDRFHDLYKKSLTPHHPISENLSLVHRVGFLRDFWAYPAKAPNNDEYRWSDFHLISNLRAKNPLIYSNHVKELESYDTMRNLLTVSSMFCLYSGKGKGKPANTAIRSLPKFWYRFLWQVAIQSRFYSTISFPQSKIFADFWLVWKTLWQKKPKRHFRTDSHSLINTQFFTEKSSVEISNGFTLNSFLTSHPFLIHQKKHGSSSNKTRFSTPKNGLSRFKLQNGSRGIDLFPSSWLPLFSFRGTGKSRFSKKTTPWKIKMGGFGWVVSQKQPTPTRKKTGKNTVNPLGQLFQQKKHGGSISPKNGRREDPLTNLNHPCFAISRVGIAPVNRLRSVIEVVGSDPYSKTYQKKTNFFLKRVIRPTLQASWGEKKEWPVSQKSQALASEAVPIPANENTKGATQGLFSRSIPHSRVFKEQVKTVNNVANVATPKPGRVYKFKTFPPEEIRYCPQCEVELLPNSIRRYRLGYIDFVSPVAHIWYMASSIPLLLNLSKTLVHNIAACQETLSSNFPPVYKWSYNGNEPTSWTFQIQPLKLPIHLFSVHTAKYKQFGFSSHFTPEQSTIVLDSFTLSSEFSGGLTSMLPLRGIDLFSGGIDRKRIERLGGSIPLIAKHGEDREKTLKKGEVWGSRGPLFGNLPDTQRFNNTMTNRKTRTPHWQNLDSRIDFLISYHRPITKPIVSKVSKWLKTNPIYLPKSPILAGKHGKTLLKKTTLYPYHVVSRIPTQDQIPKNQEKRTYLSFFNNSWFKETIDKPNFNIPFRTASISNTIHDDASVNDLFQNPLCKTDFKELPASRLDFLATVQSSLSALPKSCDSFSLLKKPISQWNLVRNDSIFKSSKFQFSHQNGFYFRLSQTPNMSFFSDLDRFQTPTLRNTGIGFQQKFDVFGFPFRADPTKAPNHDLFRFDGKRETQTSESQEKFSLPSVFNDLANATDYEKKRAWLKLEGFYETNTLDEKEHSEQDLPLSAPLVLPFLGKNPKNVEYKSSYYNHDERLDSLECVINLFSPFSNYIASEPDIVSLGLSSTPSNESLPLQFDRKEMSSEPQTQNSFVNEPPFPELMESQSSSVLSFLPSIDKEKESLKPVGKDLHKKSVLNPFKSIFSKSFPKIPSEANPKNPILLAQRSRLWTQYANLPKSPKRPFGTFLLPRKLAKNENNSNHFDFSHLSKKAKLAKDLESYDTRSLKSIEGSLSDMMLSRFNSGTGLPKFPVPTNRFKKDFFLYSNYFLRSFIYNPSLLLDMSDETDHNENTQTNPLASWLPSNTEASNMTSNVIRDTAISQTLRRGYSTLTSGFPERENMTRVLVSEKRWDEVPNSLYLESASFSLKSEQKSRFQKAFLKTLFFRGLLHQKLPAYYLNSLLNKSLGASLIQPAYRFNASKALYNKEKDVSVFSNKVKKGSKMKQLARLSNGKKFLFAFNHLLFKSIFSVASSRLDSTILESFFFLQPRVLSSFLSTLSLKETKRDRGKTGGPSGLFPGKQPTHDTQKKQGEIKNYRGSIPPQEENLFPTRQPSKNSNLAPKLGPISSNDLPDLISQVSSSQSFLSTVSYFGIAQSFPLFNVVNPGLDSMFLQTTRHHQRQLTPFVFNSIMETKLLDRSQKALFAQPVKPVLLKKIPTTGLLSLVEDVVLIDQHGQSCWWGSPFPVLGEKFRSNDFQENGGCRPPGEHSLFRSQTKIPTPKKNSRNCLKTLQYTGIPNEKELGFILQKPNHEMKNGVNPRVVLRQIRIGAVTRRTRQLTTQTAAFCFIILPSWLPLLGGKKVNLSRLIQFGGVGQRKHGEDRFATVCPDLPLAKTFYTRSAIMFRLYSKIKSKKRSDVKNLWVSPVVKDHRGKITLNHGFWLKSKQCAKRQFSQKAIFTNSSQSWSEKSQKTTVLDFFGSFNSHAKRNFLKLWHNCYQDSVLGKQRNQNWVMENPTRSFLTSLSPFLESRKGEVTFQEMYEADLFSKRKEHTWKKKSIDHIDSFSAIVKRQNSISASLSFPVIRLKPKVLNHRLSKIGSVYARRTLSFIDQTRSFSKRHVSQKAAKRTPFVFPAKPEKPSTSMVLAKPKVKSVLQTPITESIDSKHPYRVQKSKQSAKFQKRKSKPFLSKRLDCFFYFSSMLNDQLIKKYFGIPVFSKNNLVSNNDQNLPTNPSQSSVHKPPTRVEKTLSDPKSFDSITNSYGCISQMTTWGSDHASWIFFLKYMRATIYKGDFLLPAYFEKRCFLLMPRTGSVLLQCLLSNTVPGATRRDWMPPDNDQNSSVKPPKMEKPRMVQTDWSNLTSSFHPFWQRWSTTTGRRPKNLDYPLLAETWPISEDLGDLTLSLSFTSTIYSKLGQSNEINRYRKMAPITTNRFNQLISGNYLRFYASSPGGRKLPQKANLKDLTLSQFKSQTSAQFWAIKKPIPFKRQAQPSSNSTIHPKQWNVPHSSFPFSSTTVGALPKTIGKINPQASHGVEQVLRQSFSSQFSQKETMIESVSQTNLVSLVNAHYKLNGFFQAFANHGHIMTQSSLMMTYKERRILRLVISLIISSLRKSNTQISYTTRSVSKTKPTPLNRVFLEEANQKTKSTSLKNGNSYYRIYGSHDSSKESRLTRSKQTVQAENGTMKSHFYFSNEKKKVYTFFISPFEQRLVFNSENEFFNQKPLKSPNSVVGLYGGRSVMSSETIDPPSKGSVFLFSLHASNGKNPLKRNKEEQRKHGRREDPKMDQDQVQGEKLFRKFKEIQKGGSEGFLKILKKKNTISKTFILKIDNRFQPYKNPNFVPFSSYPAATARFQFLTSLSSDNSKPSKTQTAQDRLEFSKSFLTGWRFLSGFLSSRLANLNVSLMSSEGLTSMLPRFHFLLDHKKGSFSESPFNQGLKKKIRSREEINRTLGEENMSPGINQKEDITHRTSGSIFPNERRTFVKRKKENTGLKPRSYRVNFVQTFTMVKDHREKTHFPGSFSSGLNSLNAGFRFSPCLLGKGSIWWGRQEIKKILWNLSHRPPRENEKIENELNKKEYDSLPENFFRVKRYGFAQSKEIVFSALINQHPNSPRNSSIFHDRLAFLNSRKALLLRRVFKQSARLLITVKDSNRQTTALLLVISWYFSLQFRARFTKFASSPILGRCEESHNHLFSWSIFHLRVFREQEKAKNIRSTKRIMTFPYFFFSRFFFSPFREEKRGENLPKAWFWGEQPNEARRKKLPRRKSSKTDQPIPWFTSEPTAVTKNFHLSTSYDLLVEDTLVRRKKFPSYLVTKLEFLVKQLGGQQSQTSRLLTQEMVQNPLPQLSPSDDDSSLDQSKELVHHQKSPFRRFFPIKANTPAFSQDSLSVKHDEYSKKESDASQELKPIDFLNYNSLLFFLQFSTSSSSLFSSLNAGFRFSPCLLGGGSIPPEEQKGYVPPKKILWNLTHRPPREEEKIGNQENYLTRYNPKTLKISNQSNQDEDWRKVSKPYLALLRKAKILDDEKTETPIDVNSTQESLTARHESTSKNGLQPIASSLSRVFATMFHPCKKTFTTWFQRPAKNQKKKSSVFSSGVPTRDPAQLKPVFPNGSLRPPGEDSSLSSRSGRNFMFPFRSNLKANSNRVIDRSRNKTLTDGSMLSLWGIDRFSPGTIDPLCFLGKESIVPEEQRKHGGKNPNGGIVRKKHDTTKKPKTPPGEKKLKKYGQSPEEDSLKKASRFEAEREFPKTVSNKKKKEIRTKNFNHVKSTKTKHPSEKSSIARIRPARDDQPLGVFKRNIAENRSSVSNLNYREALEKPKSEPASVFSRTRNLRKLRLHYLRNFRRLRFLEYLKATYTKQEWMILSLLPVLPPDLRPVISNPRGYITGDINTHYQNVIYRNNNIEKLLDTFWIPRRFYKVDTLAENPKFTFKLSYRPGPAMPVVLPRSTESLGSADSENAVQNFGIFRFQQPGNTSHLSVLGKNQKQLTRFMNRRAGVGAQVPGNLISKRHGPGSVGSVGTVRSVFVPFTNAKKSRTQVLHDSKALQEMQYSLQKAVDALIDNSQKFQSNILLRKGRPLKSLSDDLKGKEGRFRQHLLGKRVDYSGRSVIIVGPDLKLYECGIPLIMALRLFQPFLILYLIYRFKIASLLATQLIQRKHPMIIKILKRFLETWPILLNRAPTLHRMNIQAFKVRLVQGKAILLHPLVCSSYNADFDGDQMGVHVPITQQARAESWKLLWSINNPLSIASRQPLFLPSQDMVIGNFFLTQDPLLLAGNQASPHHPSWTKSISSMNYAANQTGTPNQPFHNALGDGIQAVQLNPFFLNSKDAYHFYLNRTHRFHVNTPVWFRSSVVFETQEREKSIEMIIDKDGTSAYITKYYEKQVKRSRICSSYPVKQNKSFGFNAPHETKAPSLGFEQNTGNPKQYDTVVSRENNAQWSRTTGRRLTNQKTGSKIPNYANSFDRNLNPICLNQIIRSTFGRIEFYYEAFQVGSFGLTN